MIGYNELDHDMINIEHINCNVKDYFKNSSNLYEEDEMEIRRGSRMAEILIVDDAQFMRITLRKLLENANYKIAGEAENGLEAIELYKQLKPDLVIMDITMPVMNGIEAIQKLIAYDPEANIVVCSAMGQQRVVVEAIESGAKDFIVKPFNENNVLETIHQVLTGQNMLSE